MDQAQREQTEKLLTAMGGKAMLFQMLGSVTAMMMYMFMAGRRPKRGEPDPLHGYDWHGCLVDGCGKLIKPGAIMCTEHWCVLPVPLRMKMIRLRPTTKGWPHWKGAKGHPQTANIVKAVRFVEAEERALRKTRRGADWPLKLPEWWL